MTPLTTNSITSTSMIFKFTVRERILPEQVGSPKAGRMCVGEDVSMIRAETMLDSNHTSMSIKEYTVKEGMPLLAGPIGKRSWWPTWASPPSTRLHGPQPWTTFGSSRLSARSCFCRRPTCGTSCAWLLRSGLLLLGAGHRSLPQLFACPVVLALAGWPFWRGWLWEPCLRR